MAMSGFLHRGQPINILTNHFKEIVASVDAVFYHYNVGLSYDDGSPVHEKGIGRKVIRKLQDIYHIELAGKDFIYDGEKSLFIVGPLPQKKLEFTVILEHLSSNKDVVTGSNGSSLEDGDRKRTRRLFQSKSFKVEISYLAKIPMRALCGQNSENSQEALRVLDIILRQNAAKQGCLLVRQSLFHDRPRSFCDLGGSVLGRRGFRSTLRVTQGGLSLNIDEPTTMIIQPGPVSDFLIANQNVRNPHEIDCTKAGRMLKNLKINTSSSMEYKITVLSVLPCNHLFSLKQKSDGNAVGVSNGPSFTEIEGGILSAPKLKVRNSECFFLQNKRCNYNYKINSLGGKVQSPKIKHWAIANFSVRCDTKKIWTDLARCGRQKGIHVEDPFMVFEESPQAKHASAHARVQEMSRQIKSKLQQVPVFLFCILPETKASSIYGPIKGMFRADLGIVIQCVSPPRINDVYLTYLVVKINAELGVLNYLHGSPWLSGVAVKGTVIVLVIFNGCVVGIGDGRAILDLNATKKPEKKGQEAAATVEPEKKWVKGIFEEVTTKNKIEKSNQEEEEEAILETQNDFDSFSEVSCREAEKEREPTTFFDEEDESLDMFSDNFCEEAVSTKNSKNEQKAALKTKTENINFDDSLKNQLDSLEECDDMVGMIEMGNWPKILPIGKDMLFAAAGLTTDYVIVWQKLESVSKEFGSHIRIGEALEICSESVQKILDAEPFKFEAEICLAGLGQDGKPEIQTLRNVQFGDRVKDMWVEEKTPMEFIILGGGSDLFHKYVATNERDDQLMDILFKGVVDCSLRDRSIGGFPVFAIVDQNNTTVTREHHILRLLSDFYEDFTKILECSLFYRSNGVDYDNKYELLVRRGLLTHLLTSGLGFAWEWTHVLGVNIEMKVIIGIIVFSSREKKELAYNHFEKEEYQFSIADFTIFTPSKKIMKNIGDLFSPTVGKRDLFY